MTAEEVGEGQKVGQLRGQISALAAENSKLHRKMDTLEQDAASKQHSFMRKFLIWMEDTGMRPKEILNSWAAKETDASEGVDREEERTFPVGLAEDETRLAGSPDIVDVAQRQRRRETEAGNSRTTSSTPKKATRYEIPARFFVFDESADREYTVGSAETTRAKKDADIRDNSCNKSDKNSNRNTASIRKDADSTRSPNHGGVTFDANLAQDETRLAGSPDMRTFVEIREAQPSAPEGVSRPVTSTPMKSGAGVRRPSPKRVLFQEEVSVCRSPCYSSSTSRQHGRDRPGIAALPEKIRNSPHSPITSAVSSSSMRSSWTSSSRRPVFPCDNNRSSLRASPPKEDDFVDWYAHTRPPFKSPSNKCNQRERSKGKTTSQGQGQGHHSSRVLKDITHSSGRASRPREAFRENYSARRSPPFDAVETDDHRPSLDPDKFFDSRQNYGDQSDDHVMERPSPAPKTLHSRHLSADVWNRSKRSRRDDERAMSPDEHRHTDLSNDTGIGISGGKSRESNKNVKSTVDCLEDALQTIYEQNLEDELKITEIRRNAVRRFVAWRDAVDCEMTKLERDGNRETASPGQTLRDCSPTSADRKTSVDISEGPLSGIENSDLKIEDLEDCDSSTFARNVSPHELNAPALPADQGHGSTSTAKRKHSPESYPTSSSSPFMASPDTIIFGEVAFQLERMVLARVFRGGSKQLTGYTLSNIEKMITSHYDYRERPVIMRQWLEVKEQLGICGWNPDYHPRLVGYLIRTYGTFPSNAKAKTAARQRGWMDPRALKEAVLLGIPKEFIPDMIIILDCLFFLGKKHGVPPFSW